MKPTLHGDGRGGLPLRDALWATIVGACALVLYVATLLPDLGGPEDTPKFQFLGHVLGTAHPPGYPLYVMLSHVFVKLPVGTIAYRANLFSAVTAALACAAAYVIARQIGAGRWTSFCSALALAAGLSYWRSATIAEVYGLAAAMVALTVALFLWWRGQSDTRKLLAAVAAFALGLGNHLTIVGLLPAGAWYVFVRHRRVLTIRVTAISIAILLLGVGQYGFIILRTSQNAPYLESQARSLTELATIVTAQRFASERFAFGPTTLLTVQAPAVASEIHREMGSAGILLLGAALAVAIRRRNEAAIVVAGGAAGLLAMVLNMSGDLHGFITSAMVLLWPLAGLGMETIVAALPPLSLAPLRLGARPLALLAAAAIPFANLTANYSVSDHSRETTDATFLRGAYAWLPNRSAVVTESYWYDMVLRYLTLTGETAPGKEVLLADFSANVVREAKDEGRRVFAFAGAATFLGAEGLRFERVPLEGPPLNEWLKGLPEGSLVVGATAYAAAPIEFLPVDRQRVPALGQPRAFTAFAWIAGKPDAIVRVENTETSLSIDRDSLRDDLPDFQGIVAAADGEHAQVVVNGRAIVDVDTGLALAVFSSGGQLVRALAFEAGRPLRVPFEGALYEFAGEQPCVDVKTDTWTDIAPVVAGGAWLATLPAYGSVVMESEFSGTPGIRTQPSTILADGVIRNTSEASIASGSTVVTELARPSSRRPVFRFTLDRLPATARARLKRGGALPSLSLCANPPRPLFPPASNSGALRPDFESEAYFGPGWQGPERTGAEVLRRGNAERSTLIVPLEAGHDYHMTLDVSAAINTRIGILANEIEVGSCAVGDRTPCEVTLPSSTIRNGINMLTLAESLRPEATPGLELIFRGARLDRVN